jgi:hypothetical protein
MRCVGVLCVMWWIFSTFGFDYEFTIEVESEGCNKLNRLDPKFYEKKLHLGLYTSYIHTTNIYYECSLGLKKKEAKLSKKAKLKNEMAS